MSTPEWLIEARARVDAALPGPWVVDDDGMVVSMNDPHPGWDGQPTGDLVAGNYEAGPTGADATFIAAARTDLPRALDALRAILAIHVRDMSNREDDPDQFCADCERRWPCATARACGVPEPDDG